MCMVWPSHRIFIVFFSSFYSNAHSNVKENETCWTVLMALYTYIHARCFFPSCCCSLFSPHKDCSCWVYTFDNTYFDPRLKYMQKHWKAAPFNGLRRTFSVVLLYHRLGTFNHVLNVLLLLYVCSRVCVCAHVKATTNEAFFLWISFALILFPSSTDSVLCGFFSFFAHSRFQLN